MAKNEDNKAFDAEAAPQPKAQAPSVSAVGHVVELKPHIGYRSSPRFGRIPVRHKQDLIYVNGIHCGYVGTHKAAAVIMLEPPPEDITKAIVAHVTKVRGGVKPAKVVGAPSDEDAAEAFDGE